MNSKQKGKRGELELVHYLKDRGYTARRGQQFCGTPDSPDIITNIDNIHWECKRVEHLNINKAYNQAVSDAGDKMPVVASKKNNAKWLVTMSLDDFLQYVQLASFNKVL